MNRAALEALERLYDATGLPPPPDVDPAEVVAMADRMVAAREQPLADLTEALAGDPTSLAATPTGREVLDRIRAREALWQGALSRARYLLAERAGSFGRLRQRMPR